MADILIRGFEMPITCCHCKMIAYNPETVWNDNGNETQGAWVCLWTAELIDNTKREEHCPLFELPPHGRLIDADNVDTITVIWNECGLLKAIDAPVIIPKSEGT